MGNMAVKNSKCSTGRIMVVDDKIEIINFLCEMLNTQGYRTESFCTGSEAIEFLKNQEFDLLITDLEMPDMDGIKLIRAVLEIDPDLVCIVMTGGGTVETAVEAMKTGAFDYILKPFKLSTLMPIISRAMHMRKLRVENMQLHETIAIHELGKAIAFSSDLNSIMNKVADAALLQCDADEVSIMLPTEDGKGLYIAAICGRTSTEHIGMQVTLEQGIAGWVARNKESVVLHGEVNDPRFVPIKPRGDIHDAVSMPMLSSGKLVGVLNVNMTKKHRHFTIGLIKALGILVSIISPILEKTQLYMQIRECEEKCRLMFENMLDGLYQCLPDGKLIAVNPAFARILGYDSVQDLMENIRGSFYQLFVNPDNYAEFNRIMKMHGEVLEFEYQIYRKDKTKTWVTDNARAIADKDGALLYYTGILSDISKRKQADERLIKSVEDTIRAIAMIVEKRDPYTAGHQERVAGLAVAIAKSMNLSEEQINGIRIAGLIHDIGKMSVPSKILSKPSKLNDFEIALVRQHVETGYNILINIDFSYPIAQIVYQHHERINGSGYPCGLKENNILLEARIIAVADVVEAISSHHPYRPGLGIDKALEKISKNKGILYDPAAVDACLILFNEKGFKF